MMASTLAVGCAKGICIWRLAYAGTKEVSGAHLLRVVDVFGGPEAFPRPLSLMAWHPLGKWLAYASPYHGGVGITDGCSTHDQGLNLPFHPTGVTGMLHAAIAHMAGSSVHVAGICVLEISLCGTAMVAAGS